MMDYNALEIELEESSKRLTQAMAASCEIAYSPANQIKKHKKPRYVRIVLVAVCSVLLLAVSISAFTDDFLFIPGMGSIFSKGNHITHSIEQPVIIEKDGYTHKIVYGCIEKGRVQMEIFFYKTDAGLNMNENYGISIGNKVFNVPVDYWVYYNGKKCGKSSRSYGSSIGVSAEMPAVNKNEDMVVSLYSGDDYLGDVIMVPVETSEELTKTRSSAVVDDITLIADVQRKDSRIEVYISAVLPSEVFRGTFGKFAIVDNSQLGFKESEVLIKDSGGRTYISSVAKDVNFNDDEARLLSFWHFFTFEDVPADTNELTVVVPEVMYIIGEEGDKREVITRQGPWEIPVKCN